MEDVSGIDLNDSSVIDLPEDEADDNVALSIRPDERKLVTQPYDLSVKGLSDDIASQRILLAVEYQRQYVWDRGKASRLIESLLLNVPIPVCYFAEDSEGRYEVIDGLQRLTAINEFISGEFRLNNLAVLDELNGSTVSDLSPRDRRRLENRTIRCIVISEDSHPDIKFDVFERLNTGAAKLTAQELRNAVYRGPFNESLKSIADDETFTAIVGSANKRMDREEMVLRFFALHDRINQYRPPLRQFANEYMRDNRDLAISPERANLLLGTCATVRKIFGDKPFKMPDSTNAVNKAVFDALIIPCSMVGGDELMARKDALSSAWQKLVSEEDFRVLVGKATADRQRVWGRMNAVLRMLRECGVPVSFADFGETEA